MEKLKIHQSKLFIQTNFSQLNNNIEQEKKSIHKKEDLSEEKKDILLKTLGDRNHIPEEVNKKTIVNTAALSTGVFLDLNDGKGIIDSVNITISSEANIRHIIGTDYGDKFISPQTGGVKFVLNEGNDALELNGSNNIVLINKHAGIKTISNFEHKGFLQLSTTLRISLITDEEISISYDYQSYDLKSQCF